MTSPDGPYRDAPGIANEPPSQAWTFSTAHLLRGTDGSPMLDASRLRAPSVPTLAGTASPQLHLGVQPDIAAYHWQAPARALVPLLIAPLLLIIAGLSLLLYLPVTSGGRLATLAEKLGLMAAMVIVLVAVLRDHIGRAFVDRTVVVRLGVLYVERRLGPFGRLYRASTKDVLALEQRELRAKGARSTQRFDVVVRDRQGTETTLLLGVTEPERTMADVVTRRVRPEGSTP